MLTEISGNRFRFAGYLTVKYYSRQHSPMLNANGAPRITHTPHGTKGRKSDFVLKYLFIILWQALRFIWLMHAEPEPIIHDCIVCACVCYLFMRVCV